MDLGYPLWHGFSEMTVAALRRHGAKEGLEISIRQFIFSADQLVITKLPLRKFGCVATECYAKSEEALFICGGGVLKPWSNDRLSYGAVHSIEIKCSNSK